MAGVIVMFVKRTASIVVAAAACYGLAGRCGPVNAALIWAGSTAPACGAGAVPLLTSEVGHVT